MLFAKIFCSGLRHALRKRGLFNLRGGTDPNNGESRMAHCSRNLLIIGSSTMCRTFKVSGLLLSRHLFLLVSACCAFSSNFFFVRSIVLLFAGGTSTSLAAFSAFCFLMSSFISSGSSDFSINPSSTSLRSSLISSIRLFAMFEVVTLTVV